jgi:DUF4097 and DUF4098 domain-containing protein YvlB
MRRNDFSSMRFSRAAGVLAAAGFLGMATPAFGHHLEKHFAVQPHAVVTLHNPSGMITVKSWSKPEVRVIADHASEKVEVDAEQMGNRVDLLTHLISQSVSPDDLRADYEVTVPEDAELQIHNDSGAVEVTNVAGDMTVETVAAGVDLQEVGGYLMVKTVGGSFSCMHCTGRVDVQTISGSLRLISVQSKNVRAQTSTGNILFDGQFLPNGSYFLKNYSGTIEVLFSPGDSFDLRANSLKGKVNNDAKLVTSNHSAFFAPRLGKSLVGTYNDGRAKVELTSFSGTINVRKRD